MKQIIGIAHKEALKQKWSILLVFLVLFILTVSIGLLVKNSLVEGFGNSLQLDALKSGFNRTAFFDFINQNQGFFSNFFGNLKITFFIYAFVSIFLNGGLISNIAKSEHGAYNLIRNGVKYFIPFVLMAIIHILMVGVWTVIVFLPYTMMLGNPITDYDSELPFLYSLLSAMLIYFVGLLYIVIYGVLCRMEYVKSKQILKSLREGLKRLLSQKSSYFVWGLIVFLLHFLVITIYYYSYLHSDGSSWKIILISFFISQFLVLVRIFLKAFAYKGILTISENSF